MVNFKIHSIYGEWEKMLEGEAIFCRLQELVLEAIIKCKSPILPVIATRIIRKTILFRILAKSVSSGTTIAAIPLALLQNHIVERCQ